jgi:hypothetical protein
MYGLLLQVINIKENSCLWRSSQVVFKEKIHKNT